MWGWMRGITRPFRAAAPGPYDDYWFTPRGDVSLAGVVVTPESAMKLSAVWRAVDIVASSVAMCPLVVNQRLDSGGSVPATAHPLYRRLLTQPHPLYNAHTWKRFAQVSLLLRGNAYFRIVPGEAGPVTDLLPLHPDLVTPEELPDGRLRYQVRTQGGRSETLTDDEVWHIPGLSLNGRIGMDVISYMRDSVGIGLAQEEFAARFFGQSPKAGGILQVPHQLDVDQEAEVRRLWGRGTHDLRILTQGSTYSPMSIGLTAEQAQIVTSREFQVTDFARRLGVPPHMIGETTKETSWGSGIEQMSIGFVVYTMLPWFSLWTSSIDAELIIASGRYFTRFEYDRLLRADALSMAQTREIERRNGVISVDEWRNELNLNPLPDGAGAVYHRDSKLVRLDAPDARGPAGAPDDDEPAALMRPSTNGYHREGVPHA